MGSFQIAKIFGSNVVVVCHGCNIRDWNLNPIMLGSVRRPIRDAKAKRDLCRRRRHVRTGRHR